MTTPKRQKKLVLFGHSRLFAYQSEVIVTKALGKDAALCDAANQAAELFVARQPANGPLA